MKRIGALVLLQAGRDFSLEEAVAAEARVEVAPQRVAERLKLVGFYWYQSCRSDDFADKWCHHVLALIRHYPSAEFLRMGWFANPVRCSRDTLARIRDEWLKQVELNPASVQILDRAACFFATFDPPVADELFGQSCELDGDEGRWAFRKALLLSSQIKRGLIDSDQIAAKIKELEQTRFEQSDVKGASYVFAELAGCAFAAGFDDDAFRLANMSVNSAEPSSGSDAFDDPLHVANILLGRMAIRSSDKKEAARYLLDSARVCRSVHPEPVGPDVVLAGELLAAGERDTVEEYFTTCAGLWLEGRKLLMGWADEIKRGQTPDLSKTWLDASSRRTESIMNVRLLTPADAEAYHVVRLAALNEEPAAFGSRAEDEPNVADTAERLAAGDDRCLFGAFQEGQLVGIVRLSRYSAPNEKHRAYLGGLYVLPAFRRSGSGRSLVLAALDRAASVSGLRRINLSVVTEQTAAIRLYQSLGFRTYGTERDTFSRAGRFYDEHLMTLEIGLREGFRPRVANCNVTTVADTSAPGCDLVRQWLREYNQFANPDFMEQIQQPEHEARPLVLLATVDSDVVGGLFAETRLAWLHISIMAVSLAWRSRGIGAALLAEAGRQAVDRGCKYAFVDTMDYQAPRFYLAHGFRIVGEIPDWDSNGHAKIFLSKGLTESAGLRAGD